MSRQSLRLASPQLAHMATDSHLVFRDATGRLQSAALSSGLDRLIVGRERGVHVRIDWDPEVSRQHAELERLGNEWVIADNGLSRNGTFVNGERVAGRHRLRDGDVVLVGTTTMTFLGPAAFSSTETQVGKKVVTTLELTSTQRSVLAALCHPYVGGSPYATPATNQQIADKVFLSVDSVKTHLRTLFQKFNVDGLPQNQKRAKLVELAFRSGVVSKNKVE